MHYLSDPLGVPGALTWLKPRQHYPQSSKRMGKEKVTPHGLKKKKTSKEKSMGWESAKNSCTTVWMYQNLAKIMGYFLPTSTGEWKPDFSNKSTIINCCFCPNFWRDQGFHISSILRPCFVSPLSRSTLGALHWSVHWSSQVPFDKDPGIFAPLKNPMKTSAKDGYQDLTWKSDFVFHSFFCFWEKKKGWSGPPTPFETFGSGPQKCASHVSQREKCMLRFAFRTDFWQQTSKKQPPKGAKGHGCSPSWIHASSPSS